MPQLQKQVPTNQFLALSIPESKNVFPITMILVFVRSAKLSSLSQHKAFLPSLLTGEIRSDKRPMFAEFLFHNVPTFAEVGIL